LPSGNVRHAAQHYLRLGFTPVPLRAKTKAPRLNGWPQLQADGYDLDQLFPANTALNIGLLLGEPSRGLVDVDLDAVEAIRAAGHLLPETGWVSGRASKPRSHYWYRAQPRLAEKVTAFRDQD